jgi:hypothetical protein
MLQKNKQHPERKILNLHPFAAMEQYLLANSRFKRTEPVCVAKRRDLIR